MAAVSTAIGFVTLMIAFFNSDGCLVGCAAPNTGLVWLFVSVAVGAGTMGLTALTWTFTGWQDRRLVQAAGFSFVGCVLLVVWLFRM